MAESVLDLRAIEAQLPPPTEWEDRERTLRALLVHCRALRAALAPFVINVGAKEGTPAIVREKGNAWFELAYPKWGDFERAALVFGAAQDGEAQQ